MVVNEQTGTRLDEIADGIYRISTPVSAIPGGFSFNQYLVADEQPLLFHTGQRRMFQAVSDAIRRVLPLERLRWIGCSHFEADECGAMNDFLAVAPAATPLCGRIAAMTSIEDFAIRPPRALGDGESISLGRHAVSWIDAPHVPHAWECGFLHERSTGTLLCGDLFTQGGTGEVALTESEVLSPSEAMRKGLDYWAHGRDSRRILERMAALEPRTLACMHGSAFRGDGAALLRGLADAVER